MSKQHRDFVTYIRNGVEINALVAFSHDIYTPATQTEEAKTVEHLTLVYLDPAAASNGSQTGEQLRSSIKTEYSVPPLIEGSVNGWKDKLATEQDQVIAGLKQAVEENTARGVTSENELRAQIVELEATVQTKTDQVTKSLEDISALEAKIQAFQAAGKPVDVSSDEVPPVTGPGVGQPAPTE